MSELNKLVKELEINKDIAVMKSRRLSKEGINDAVDEYISNIKNKLFDIIKQLRKDKVEFSKQIESAFDSKLEETKVKGFFKQSKELSINKDSNVKALDKDVTLSPDIIKAILTEGGSVVNAEYVKERIVYTDKVAKGAIKYFQDKKVAVSVIVGIIQSIIKELNKDTEVNYEKIENSLKEIHDVVDLGLISNMSLNFNKLDTIPRVIIKSEAIDYKTIDIDKSYKIYGTYGSMLILAKLTEPKDVIFPISIRVVDVDYYGEGYIAKIEELEDLIKNYDVTSDTVNKLHSDVKNNHISYVIATANDAIKDLDNLVQGSVYDNPVRFEKDVNTIDYLVKIAVNLRDSIVVDINLLDTIFKLTGAFSVYISESIKHYE